MAAAQKLKIEDPPFLWAFWTNQYGCAWRTPQKVFRVPGLAGWWHTNGNAHVQCTGLVTADRTNGYTVYASHERRLVETFIQGYFAAQQQMLVLAQKAN